MFFWQKKPSVPPQPVSSQQHKILLSGLHCVSCSLNIDGALEDLPGVVKSTTSYARSLTIIQFDPDQVTLPQIQGVIEQLGYQVVQTTLVE